MGARWSCSPEGKSAKKPSVYEVFGEAVKRIHPGWTCIFNRSLSASRRQLERDEFHAAYNKPSFVCEQFEFTLETHLHGEIDSFIYGAECLLKAHYEDRIPEQWTFLITIDPTLGKWVYDGWEYPAEVECFVQLPILKRIYPPLRDKMTTTTVGLMETKEEGEVNK